MQAIASGLDVRFLSSPAQKKSLGTQFRWKRPQLFNLFCRKVSFLDFLSREIWPQQFDINANFSAKSNRNHREAVRVREIETNGRVCAKVREPWLALRTEQKPDCLRRAVNVPASKSRRIPRAAMKRSRWRSKMNRVARPFHPLQELIQIDARVVAPDRRCQTWISLFSSVGFARGDDQAIGEFIAAIAGASAGVSVISPTVFGAPDIGDWNKHPMDRTNVRADFVCTIL